MRRLLPSLLIIVGLLGAALAAEIQDLSITDAPNVDPFPENMAPSAINDGARALEGIIARYYQDTNCSGQTTGTAAAVALAATQTLSAYYDGLLLCFDAATAVSAGATLNVDSLGAATMYKRNDVELEEGDIEAGQKVLVVYDGASFQMLSQSAIAPTVITLAAPQATTSGTTANFTSIPSGTKKITFMLNAFSSNGTGILKMTLGDSGGLETTGYVGSADDNAGTATNGTTGFLFSGPTVAARQYSGLITLALLDSTNNIWTYSGVVTAENASGVWFSAGHKALSAELTQLSFFTSASDTFDNGSVNIQYE